MKVRIVAGNLYDCLGDFLTGRSDLLLCYDFPDMNPLLERNDLLRNTLSTDRLMPVACTTAEYEPFDSDTISMWRSRRVLLRRSHRTRNGGVFLGLEPSPRAPN